MEVFIENFLNLKKNPMKKIFLAFAILGATLSQAQIETFKKYNEVHNFSEGFAKVELNGKWGFINQKGEEIIPLKYDNVEHFSEGFAIVKLNGKYGFINKEGKKIIPIKYDYIHRFSEGFAKVKLNGKWGFINTKGKEIVPPLVRASGSYPFIGSAKGYPI